MWCLDPVNSGELIDQLRPHARYEVDVVWVGEGWRPLVEQCHRQLSAVFPEYELLNIEQKWGVLAYQAFPRRRVEGETRWSSEEQRQLDEIVEGFQARSETVCEWCGAEARLREWRTAELTLCDACDGRFRDPPVLGPHDADL